MEAFWLSLSTAVRLRRGALLRVSSNRVSPDPDRVIWLIPAIGSRRCRCGASSESIIVAVVIVFEAGEYGVVKDEGG